MAASTSTRKSRRCGSKPDCITRPSVFVSPVLVQDSDRRVPQPRAAVRAGSPNVQTHGIDLPAERARRRGQQCLRVGPAPGPCLTELEQIAVALFAEHGYQQVSYDDVAAAAGVSARTVYRYFPAKEDFVLCFVYRSAAEIEMALGQLRRSRHPINDVIELIISFSELFQDSLEEVIVWWQAVSSDREAESRVHGEQTILLERLLLDFCLDGSDETVVEVMSARATRCHDGGDHQLGVPLLGRMRW